MDSRYLAVDILMDSRYLAIDILVASKYLAIDILMDSRYLDVDILIDNRYLSSIVMQILGNERQPRFISTLSGWAGAVLGRGEGGGFSRQREGETGIYVRSCDCNSLFCCPPCDQLLMRQNYTITD